MKLFSVIVVLATLCLQNVSATLWYGLQWYTPSTSAQFQHFSMQMVAPTLQKAGVYYLWPGLQDTGSTGVYQEVLDGTSGYWWIGSGWCCSNPSLAWGSGFNVPNGDTITISMTRDTNDADWSSTLSMGSNYASNKFPLAYKNFNEALLAIELDDETWDFGQLVWNDVVMVVNTTSTAWCTNGPINYSSAAKYTMSGVKATVSGGSTTCTITQVVMEGPA